MRLVGVRLTFALVALVSAAIVSSIAEASSSKPPTFALLARLAGGTPIARSELTPIVEKAVPNMNEGGKSLAESFFLSNAVGSVEIDVQTPSGAGSVLFFVFGTHKSLGVDLGVQYGYMATLHNAAKLGTIVGYPSTSGGVYRSLVWDQPGANQFGAPTAATFAGIVVNGDVVNDNTGTAGGVIVEGVAVSAGTTAPPASTAIALAKWGVAHLARVDRSR